VFFTIERIRNLGRIFGVIFVIVGLAFTALLFQPAGAPVSDWLHQHLATAVSFVTFPITGFAVIVFTSIYTRPWLVEGFVKGASVAGYTASKDEMKSLEEMFRVAGKLSLLLPSAYTIFWLLHIYFLVEPAGIFASQSVRIFYIILTFSLPMLLIVYLVPIRLQRERYSQTRTLFRKTIEGAKEVKRDRESTGGRSGDVQVVKKNTKERKDEDEQSP
jgi:sensor histidine kinase YesM